MSWFSQGHADSADDLSARVDHEYGRTALTTEEWHALAAKKPGTYLVIRGDGRVETGSYAGAQCLFDGLRRAEKVRVVEAKEYELARQRRAAGALWS